MADFELDIKPAKLEEAAGKYSDASTSFGETLGELQGLLTHALDVWVDSSHDEWETRVKQACTELEQVKTLLKDNSTALNEIAQFAKDSESDVYKGVSAL